MFQNFLYPIDLTLPTSKKTFTQLFLSFSNTLDFILEKISSFSFFVIGYRITDWNNNVGR